MLGLRRLQGKGQLDTEGPGGGQGPNMRDASESDILSGAVMADGAAPAHTGSQAPSPSLSTQLPPVQPPLVHVDPATIEWILEGGCIGFW